MKRNFSGRFGFASFFVGTAFLLMGITFSCRDEYGSYREGNIVLEFSQDTVCFDTVFTTQPSITRKVTVRNPYKEAVLIDRIYLQGGGSSRFRVNVNGDTSLVQNQVTIGGLDSLYVFVNTSIDYRNQNNPFEIVDYLCFESGGSRPQSIVLVAWGQDANYWKSDYRVRVPFSDPGMINPDADSLYLSCFDYDETRHSFSDPKPYVIYGYMCVGRGKTLRIPAGTKIYFAPRSGIWVQEGAKLEVGGLPGQPVLFTSLRQDGNYRNMAGQWGRIWLSAESGPHEVDYAWVRNAQTGFWLDSCLEVKGGLTIRNSKIENMSSYAIFCQQNQVQGYNLCFSQAQSILYFHKGGNYTFVHCTFANDYSGGYGGSRCLSLNDYETDFSGEKREYPLEKAVFANSSFTGRNSMQLRLDLVRELDAYPQLSFVHCLLTQDPVSENTSCFDSCQWNKEPFFVNPGNYDFEIDSLASALVGKGDPAYVEGDCRLDLAGRNRKNPPSIGAYEFYADSLSLWSEGFHRRKNRWVWGE